MTDEELARASLREAVRGRYAAVASRPTEAGCCGSAAADCCSSGRSASPGPRGGGCCGETYTASDREGLPRGADMGLGCGNPTSLLTIEPGSTVLDLGSGAGADCFLAARRVGPTGRVIGVDMTSEMVARARTLAASEGCPNIEFRLGEIEHLPVADQSVDVVISNCVINLSLDKSQVYREAYRVLRPGGRLAVADVLATRPISAEARQDPTLWSGCSSGALTVAETVQALASAGFESIEVEVAPSPSPEGSLAPQGSLGVRPGVVRARRGPTGASG